MLLPRNLPLSHPSSALAQRVIASFSVVLSAGAVGVVWITYGTPAMSSERQLMLWYAIVVKPLQMLLDMALAGYPTSMRQMFVILCLVLRVCEVFYLLYLVRKARDVLLRPVRPPLVIKALLDMKGDAHVGAEPLTLGMLERLEGIVKVRDRPIRDMHLPNRDMHLPHRDMHLARRDIDHPRRDVLPSPAAQVRDQAKFHIRNGRQTLTFAMLVLLIFSALQWGWEFAKVRHAREPPAIAAACDVGIPWRHRTLATSPIHIVHVSRPRVHVSQVLTYQSRYFSDSQLDEMTRGANMPMYWPSRAYDAESGLPSATWDYNEGSSSDCDECEMPRTEENTRPKPIPSGNQRVVVVVLGGLSAEQARS